MALSIAPRLSEVRRAVAVRCHMGPQAERSPGFRAELDEWVREAFHTIVNEADFLVLKVALETDLIHGQHAYDIPDGMKVGDIDQVLVRAAPQSTGNGKQVLEEYPLMAGVREYERNAWAMPAPDPETGEQEDRTGLPIRYEIIDQNFMVYPAPNTELYDTLIVRGYRMPPEPVHDDDRVEVDKEALIRLATAIGKSARRLPDAQDARARYETYVAKVRGNESEGETLRIGGGFSRKFPYVRPRRNVGPDYSRYPFWTPPP